MKKDNRIVVDISKCQWARFFYRNQTGETKDTLPTVPTVRGCDFNPAAVVFGSRVTTMLECAVANKILDYWYPVLILKLSASTTLEYTGEKAVSLYKAWCERVFNKRGKKK